MVHLEEVRRFADPPADLVDLLFRGTAPVTYDRGLTPDDWYPSYVATYVERDARTILNVGDLQLRDHPLRGAIFETWVASEIRKARVHRGWPPGMSLFRDRKGREVDVVSVNVWTGPRTAGLSAAW